jgi:hypothetical protein
MEISNLRFRYGLVDQALCLKRGLSSPVSTMHWRANRSKGAVVILASPNPGVLSGSVLAHELAFSEVKSLARGSLLEEQLEQHDLVGGAPDGLGREGVPAD